MLKIFNPMYSSLKLSVILVVAVVATGCVSAKSQPAVPATSSAPASLTNWTVVAGNHLWGIAGTWEVFNVAEKWPLLYKANLDQIDDADLIFPGQVLDIPQDSSLGEIDAAVQHAKTRGAWAMGPMELSDKEYLKNSP